MTAALVLRIPEHCFYIKKPSVCFVIARCHRRARTIDNTTISNAALNMIFTFLLKLVAIYFGMSLYAGKHRKNISD